MTVAQCRLTSTGVAFLNWTLLPRHRRPSQYNQLNFLKLHPRIFYWFQTHLQLPKGSLVVIFYYSNGWIYQSCETIKTRTFFLIQMVRKRYFELILLVTVFVLNICVSVLREHILYVTFSYIYFFCYSTF